MSLWLTWKTVTMRYFQQLTIYITELVTGLLVIAGSTFKGKVDMKN